MTKTQTMARSAVVLAAFSLVAKVLSALYRIPLTNLLGAEGMGMYQLVFSIYALVLALTTGGIPLAVSRVVAENRAKEKDTRNVLKSALITVCTVSILISVILIFTGKFIARLQGNERVAFGYALITPSILFVGALCMFRGWFQGNCNVIPTAISQVIEQLIKLIAGLFFAKLLLPRGLLYGVYGALLGVAVSELCALIYIIVTYLFTKKEKDIKLPSDTFKESNKEIMKISFTFAITGFIIPFSQFIDGIAIVNILKLIGIGTSEATAQYGLFSGTVMSVVNMPIVLTLSLSVALVPVISANRINRNLENIILKSATSIKLSYVIGLPAALLMFVFARPIIEVLYPRLTVAEITIAANLLRITCFSVLFSAQREIYGSLLMALDCTGATVRNNVIAVLFKTAVMIILLVYYGIAGAAWATLVLGVTATFLNVVTFNKLVGKNVKLVKNISTIIVSSAIMMLIAMLMFEIISTGYKAILVGGLVSGVVYLFCLMLFSVFYAGELQGVPFSSFFDKLSAKLRFWENNK